MNALLDITDATPDRKVAMMLAAKAVERERLPYCFSINHDVRPPKLKPCPVEYDWRCKDSVGIQTNSKSLAESWLVKALMLGYKIERVSPKDRQADGGSYTSIEIARSRARYHQAPKREVSDDDIPF